MSQGFMIGSECADWWDRQLKDYERDLEQYVLDNPGYFSVAVATAGATGAEFAHSMIVDLARLGEGFAEGGVKGVVQDIFRILAVVPEGRILKVAKPLTGRMVQVVQNFRIWREVGGGLCQPISIAQAMQRTGTKLAVGLAEIAKALGEPLRAMYKSGAEWANIGPALKKLGVSYGQVLGITNFGELMRLAGQSEGPILVRLLGTFKQGEALVTEAHAVLVSRTLSGVKIIDRAGMFSTFEELAKRYGNVGPWVLDVESAMFSLRNAVFDPSLIRMVDSAGLLASLVRQSVAVFDFNRTRVTPSAVDQHFQEYVRNRGSARRLQANEIVIRGGKSVEVRAGHPSLSTLSGIAKAEYGTWDLWPLVYDLNRDKIGADPNLLQPGMKLLLLPLSTYTQQELASAKRRAPSWKR